jgi:hypothetical protein
MTNSPHEWAWVCKYLDEHLRAAVVKNNEAGKRYVYLYATGPMDALKRLERAVGGRSWEKPGPKGGGRRWQLHGAAAQALWQRLRPKMSEETVVRVGEAMGLHATRPAKKKPKVEPQPKKRPRFKPREIPNTQMRHFHMRALREAESHDRRH